MLRSLFGDVAKPRAPNRATGVEVDAQGFASTAVLETEEIEAEHGSALDRRQRDLLVSTTPADTLRQHFAATRDDESEGDRFVTLFDPAQMWAGAMVKALSDASGRPVDRLMMRDQYSLATLAVIERTVVPRRQDESLKIYHAEVQRPGTDMVAMSAALMERAHLLAVIVGPMHPAAVDAMIEMLGNACAAPQWRCPQVLFMLPVNALWIAQKIAATPWPERVQVRTLSEPLTSASAVWNKLLAHWTEIHDQPGGVQEALAGAAHAQAGVSSLLQPSGFASRAPFLGLDGPGPQHTPAGGGEHLPATAAVPHGLDGVTRAPLGDAHEDTIDGPLALELEASADTIPAPLHDTSHGHAHGHAPGTWSPDLDRTGRAMHDLLLLDGVLLATLVDGTTGSVVAADLASTELERAAHAAAEIMRVHRRNLRMLGHWRPGDPVDEVLVTAGNRYHVMRCLAGHPDHFILCVLDKLRSNLATTRFRIMEAQQALS